MEDDVENGKVEVKKLRRLSFEFTKGIYHDNVKNTILMTKWLLQGLCTWPDNNRKHIVVINFISFVNSLVFEILHVAYVISVYYDLASMADSTATVTAVVEGIVRTFIVIMKKSVINDIIYKVWVDFWPVSLLDPEDERKMVKKVRIIVALPSTFLSLSILCNTQIVGDPFVHHSGLILESLFPFEKNQTYVYEALYVWQYFSDWFILFIISAFDFLFITLVAICVSQFMILQEVIRQLLTEKTKRHREIIFGKGWEKLGDMDVLLECLKQHERLIEICSQLENSFQFVIMIQFFNSTSAICMSSFVLKVNGNQFFKMLTFMAAHVLQLFYYCYVGNELAYQSSAMADAIYECNWNLQYNRKFRKTLVMMIQRAQKAQVLTAAGITELDFASFLKVMRISFSIYTLLDTIMQEKMGGGIQH